MSTPDSTLPAEVLERRDRAKAWFEALQQRICAELERLEDEAPPDLYGPELYPDEPGRFDFRPWTRETGVGGGIGGFFSGRLFEKAGVHTSAATARFSPEMAKTMPGADKDPSYVSASISLIVHPRSPRVPTVHMNTRFLSTAESWFGGGADLTPMFPAEEDARDFHAALKRACDAHDAGYYPRFKQWCDEYFFLPHRNEPRGAGGIFYDHLNSGDWEKDFAFTRDVGLAFLDIYPQIVRRRMNEKWTEEERAHQLIRRGRYVEFNLLYDRGTQFGLKTGGNVEAILMSLPPEARWP
jgi:coproporphyrinogen III oxidase